MLIYFQNFIGELKAFFTSIKQEVLLTIPYFAQDPESEEDTDVSELAKKLNKEIIFEKIIDSSCGLVCLKMVLSDKFQNSYSIVDLVSKAIDHGCYTLLDNKRLSDLPYIPFSKFIKDEFNLDSEVCKILSFRRIKYEVSKGNYVIASVHWDIKDKENIPLRKGGHLVLITGYSEKKKCFYINNPSGYEGISRVNYEIEYSKFEKFFAGRGIVIDNRGVR